MEVRVVPLLQDNYGYLIIDTATKTAAIVDPVEPDKVLAAVSEAGVTLEAVLTTHQHWDHAGGNVEMAQRVPGIKIYGGTLDNIPAVTNTVGDGDKIQVGSLTVSVLDTACHTPGHVCYCVNDAVFTGDTMFVSGCGNFNDGTPQQMYTAMLEKLGGLPAETKVYCGHEYTVKNLMYALSVEPENEKIQQKLAWAKEQRARNEPTVPSTIADEWATNPFMRVREPAVQAYTGEQDPVKGIFVVRTRKTAWRP